MKTNIFLCHASEDKQIVERYYEGLRSFDDINPWYDKKTILAGRRIPEALQEAITAAPVFLLFWSKAACDKYIKEGPEGFSNIKLEVNLALFRKNVTNESFNATDQLLIVVRLDDTPLVAPLDVRLQSTRHIDGRDCYYENVKATDIDTHIPPKRIDIPNSAREVVEWKEWRAVNEIVGSIRGVVPVYGTEVVLEINGKSYLEHVWIGGNSGDPEKRNGTAYVEECIDLKRGEKNVTLIPAILFGGGTGFRIKIPKHVKQGYFIANIPFGSSLESWSEVDLTKHREIRFNARAFVNGISVRISLCDTSHGETTECGHRETNTQIIELGYTWKPCRPYSIKLDDFDWTKTGTPKNSGAVQRSSMLQLIIGTVGMNWPDGNYTIEFKQVVVI